VRRVLGTQQRHRIILGYEDEAIFYAFDFLVRSLAGIVCIHKEKLPAEVITEVHEHLVLFLSLAMLKTASSPNTGVSAVVWAKVRATDRTSFMVGTDTWSRLLELFLDFLLFDSRFCEVGRRETIIQKWKTLATTVIPNFVRAGRIVQYPHRGRLKCEPTK
jgi:hypothetical protein